MFLGTAIVNATATNDAPTNDGTNPAAQTVVEDGSLALSLSSIDVADIDNSSLTLTFGPTNGTLTLAAGTGAATGVTLGVNTVAGTLAQLNAYLDQVCAVPFAPTAD